MSSTPRHHGDGQHDAAGRWWKSLFNASLDAQIICRADGSVAHANPKAGRLFKLPAEMGPGMVSIHNVLPPAARQIFDSISISPSADPQRGKSLKVVFDDGGSLVMDLDFIPMPDGYILINFRDTTTAHRLESHVQRLITAIDATPDVFLVTDRNFQITYVNPAFQSATGYGIEEVMGRTDQFLRAPSEQGRVAEYLDLVRQGREWVGELVNLRSNGEAYLVESTISPIFDLAGGFMGYVTSERDVTLRKQLQEELREERDFARSILQSLDSAIYSLDHEFKLILANDGWQQLPEEHAGIHLNGKPETGRYFLDYVPDPARRETLRSLFQKAREFGKTQSDYYHSADGRHWMVKITPLVAGSQSGGLILRVEDHSLYDEIQNQRFQSQKMEIIGTVAAGVAHDFNNLLQVIMGHVQLLQMQLRRDPALPAAFGLSLEKISMASVRARDITQQLLAFSRGRDERHAVLDLNSVIADAARLARPNLRENVVMDLLPADEPVEVRMDYSRATQALINLFANSQEAMPEGGVIQVVNAVVPLEKHLAIRHHLPVGRHYARCSVRDHGAGIPPEILSRIFQPHFSAKSISKGTGFGLPIVQRIVREADGFLDVESAAGQGAVFHIYLPLARGHHTVKAEKPEQALKNPKGRILVVDDVELLRDFAQNFLESAGFTVLTAKNGEEAILMLEHMGQPVDLILSDYNMPAMNGVDLIKKIAPRWPGTKFILASGYLDDQARENIRQQNASTILKPYSVEDLTRLIIKELESG